MVRRTHFWHGFQHEQLKELALRLPGAPDWMNPKAINNGLEVEPWHRKAAARRGQLAEVALELRAVGDAERRSGF